MDERERRIGLNEALFREVNERVRGVSREFGDPEGVEFVCECGEASCTRRVRMSLAPYERMRADPALFVVLPGHELPDVETVVEQNEDYAVVRKHQGGPEELAERMHPRG
jgi:hypothetical protein